MFENWASPFVEFYNLLFIRLNTGNIASNFVAYRLVINNNTVEIGVVDVPEHRRCTVNFTNHQRWCLGALKLLKRCFPFIYQTLKLLIKIGNLFTLCRSTHYNTILFGSNTLNEFLQSAFLFIRLNFLRYGYFIAERHQNQISSCN